MLHKMKPYKMPPHDYSALRSRIIERYGYECAFAEKMNLNKHLLSNRLLGKNPFHPNEIYEMCDLLEIPYADIPQYFHVYVKNEPEKKGLRKIIKEKFKTESAFARALGTTARKLSLRLNFEVDFRYSELCAIAECLGITIHEVNTLLSIEKELANEQG